MASTDVLSTTEKGTNFEQEVLKLFSLMGYNVERNRLLNGRQIDIYGEKESPPGDKIRIAIECKDQEGNVSVTDVDSFFTKIYPSLNDRSLDRGYIISKSDFSGPAKESAIKNKIVCQTYSELLRSLISFDHYIDYLIDDYNDSPISKHYIDLEGSLSASGEGQEIKIESYIQDWVKQKRVRKNHISILGEYGTGKTTLCKRLAHDFAKEYKLNPASSRIPILVNLRDYSKAMNLQQLITDLLVNTHRLLGMNYSIFMKMNEAGKFVLLFDGFDEMAQKVSNIVTVLNFEELAKTAKPEESKVILTCRTEYFRSNREEREILSSSEGKYIDLKDRPNFEILYLLPFSLSKIKLFLQKIDYSNADQNFEKIRETYNLYELSKRPVLLDMIAISLPQLAQVGKTVNAGKLYEVYTDEWVRRDIASGRAFLTQEIKEQIVLKLAHIMFYENIPNLSYQYLRDFVRKEFRLEDEKDIDYCEHEVQECAFLKREANDNFTFVHKSFMEFFVAKSIIKIIQNGKNDGLSVALPIEIIGFIANLADNKIMDHLWTRIQALRGKNEQEIGFEASNYTSILTIGGFNFEGKDLSKSILTSVNLTGGSFQKADFSNSILRSATISNTNLNQAKMNNADLTDCLIGDSGRIQSVLFGPKDDLFMCTTTSGHLQLFDSSSQAEIKNIKAHDYEILTGEFSRDKTFFSTGGRDSSSSSHLKEWRSYTFKLEKDEAVRGSISRISYSRTKDFLSAGDILGRIYLFSFPAIKLVKTAQPHDDQILSLQFDEDNSILFSSSKDGEIRAYSLPELDYIHAFKQFSTPQLILHFNNELFCMNYHPQSFERLQITKLIFKNNKFEKIGNWKTPFDCLCRTISFKIIQDKVIALAIQKNSNAILIIDVGGEDIKSIKNQSKGIKSMDISEDTKHIILGDLDGSISIIDIETETKITEIRPTFSGKGLSIKGVIGLTKEATDYLIANGAIQ